MKAKRVLNRDLPDRMKPTFEIDGSEFASLGEFYDLITDRLLKGATWGRNLDAFNDILSGGFGTPEQGFVIEWKNHEVSRRLLSDLVTKEGRPLFDVLVEIIEDHGESGRWPTSGVELRLL